MSEVHLSFEDHDHSFTAVIGAGVIEQHEPGQNSAESLASGAFLYGPLPPHTMLALASHLLIGILECLTVDTEVEPLQVLKAILSISTQDPLGEKLLHQLEEEGGWTP